MLRMIEENGILNILSISVRVYNQVSVFQALYYRICEHYSLMQLQKNHYL